VVEKFSTGRAKKARYASECPSSSSNRGVVGGESKVAVVTSGESKRALRQPRCQERPTVWAGRIAHVSRAVAVRRSRSSVMTISNDDIDRPTCSGVQTAVT
jgi:hypothetical protein